MKTPYVNELEPNRVVTTSFLVHSKEIRQKKTGELYLSLMLGDRTGDLDAKMWDNVNDVLDEFERDDFVKVKGLIQVFHNRPQLTIHKVRRMDDSEIDFGDYFPASSRHPDEMWNELRGIVSGIANVHLKALLNSLLDDEDISRRYRRAPAAKQIHHAYLGGLIEHVLSLCTLARATAPHYPNVDLDLLLTGVVLHDIGKIYELNYERGFSYSNAGQLIGHINIGMRMVDDKVRDLPDFPPALRSLIDHMILSHHGQLEYGSPKLPQFPEALLLHFLDDLDSKMECMRALIDNDRQVEGCFTTYSTSLMRAALKKDRYLEGRALPPERIRPAAADTAKAEARFNAPDGRPNGNPGRGPDPRAANKTAAPAHVVIVKPGPPPQVQPQPSPVANPATALVATSAPTPLPLAANPAAASALNAPTPPPAVIANTPAPASPSLLSRPVPGPSVTHSPSPSWAAPVTKPTPAWPITGGQPHPAPGPVARPTPALPVANTPPASPSSPVVKPAPPPVAKPEVAAEHPLFRPKMDSPFADKLKQALQPKQDH